MDRNGFLIEPPEETILPRRRKFGGPVTVGMLVGSMLPLPFLPASQGRGVKLRTAGALAMPAAGTVDTSDRIIPKRPTPVLDTITISTTTPNPAAPLVTEPQSGTSSRPVVVQAAAVVSRAPVAPATVHQVTAARAVV